MNKAIAQELVILRAKNGWTQQQLAARLGTTQRTIAAWESGETLPRKTMCVRIAQVFQLPDDYFLESGESPANTGKYTDLMKQIDHVLSESEHFRSVEEKDQYLQQIQKIFTISPEDM